MRTDALNVGTCRADGTAAQTGRSRDDRQPDCPADVDTVRIRACRDVFRGRGQGGVRGGRDPRVLARLLRRPVRAARPRERGSGRRLVLYLRPRHGEPGAARRLGHGHARVDQRGRAAGWAGPARRGRQGDRRRRRAAGLHRSGHGRRCRAAVARPGVRRGPGRGAAADRAGLRGGVSCHEPRRRARSRRGRGVTEQPDDVVQARPEQAPPGLADLVSLADPVVIADPYPLLARFREASPFAELDGALVVIGRYEDCSAILRDPRASSERDQSRLVPPELREQERTRSFLSLDPPDHTRLRRLVAKAFTPRVVATLAPRIGQITHGLLTEAVKGAGGGGRRDIEIVSQLAYPLPVRIISELLGVPAGDHSRFAGWSARLAHSLQPQFGPADGSQAAAVQQARLEFADYFREL